MTPAAEVISNFWGELPSAPGQYYLSNPLAVPVKIGDGTGLLPGVYDFDFDERKGLVMTALDMISDEEVELPDCPSSKIAAEIQQFWNSRDRYERFKVLFKRGILLEGAPGCGKTMLIRRLARDIVNHQKGIVIDSAGMSNVGTALTIIRKQEPLRPIVVVMEDIERLLHYNEECVLSLLDGEHQIDGVVYVATTNDITKLPPRIKDRPSRFDVVMTIKPPSFSDRKHYIQSFLDKNDVSDLHGFDLETCARDTNNLSVAHLKELMVAIFVLGQKYTQVLARLKRMQTI